MQVRAGCARDHAERARGTASPARWRAPTRSGGKWAREEIWSFAADDALRVAAAEGAEGIDPVAGERAARVAAIPGVPHGATIRSSTVVERSRGLANADDNRLTLNRDLWLDFDHGGFTAVDNIPARCAATGAST